MKTARIWLIAGSLVGVTLACGSPAAAKCGDGITTVGEACDNGTPTCAAGAKNVGAECTKSEDCQGLSANPHTGAAGDLCRCTLGSCINGIGNRDDVSGACRSTCMPPMCGDGVSDPGEQCDPGASTSTSGPCLGNVPNSVCANAGGLCHGGGGNALALVGCTNDAQCAVCGGTCTGNPACNRAQCGDKFVCSDASCLSGNSPLSSPAGGPSPEGCDDGNTSNMDSCNAFGFSFVAGGVPAIPDQCQANLCGDGATNMGVEECDAGTSLCISGPKATVPPSKPCCTNDDCGVGSVTGVCSNAVAAGNSNNPGTANTCRCTCKFASCGDGISDSALGEQCDDGTTTNGPGKFCNKVHRCVGGENPGALCTDNSTCTKGHCGPLVCEENVCGDDTLAGNEMCDDSNTVAANGSSDNCGVSTTTAAAINSVLKPGCDTTLTGALANQPTACIQANCALPFCGDGVTNAGEMCDAGTGLCSASTFNPGSPCTRASQCKNLPGTLGDQCGPGPSGPGNRDDVPNRCRSTCMPPGCGDGVSDSNEQCDTGAANGPTKPCTSVCTLNTCGDGQVCSDPACTSGPNGGPEECDDGNAVDPSATNTDVCGGALVGSPDIAPCAAAKCGDGVTNPGEQCDSTSMGCSNMGEDLSPSEQPFDCCLDGNVVDGSKVGSGPGLLSVEQGFTALIDCRLPNLIGKAACDQRLQKLLLKIEAGVLAANVYFEEDEVTRARRLLLTAETRLIRLSRRVVRATGTGGPCTSNRQAITNQTANAAHLVIGIAAHLTENAPPFGP